MKNYVVISCLALAGVVSGCQKHEWVKTDRSCSAYVSVNAVHPMKDSIQAIINRYVLKGLPGIQVAVKNDNGFYINQAGYANPEKKSVIEPCSASWLFSITKTYTASLIMKQREKGIINLDAYITGYLPGAVSQKIKGSNQITVRMLLNHTSGLAEFTSLPQYLSGQYAHPLEQPSIPDILLMMAEQELVSTPGKVFSYCNTNYLLLTVILETVTGKPYEQLLKTSILEPLKLQHTYFNITKDQIHAAGFPGYYADLSANGQLENVTSWNNALGNACSGWGGIAATASDVILFYEALMRGQVVSNASLNEMKKWFEDEGSNQPQYGLGIEYYQYAEGTAPQMGHEGDGVGCSTMVLYIPSNNTYLYINCTAGRKLGGPYLFLITDLKNELGKYVATWSK